VFEAALEADITDSRVNFVVWPIVAIPPLNYHRSFCLDAWLFDGLKMGNPRNYSLELPERCLLLLDELWSRAQVTRSVDRPDLGPLTSTFLISMSMPIINLPIERIERRGGNEASHYASDRPVDPAAANAIVETLQRRSFGDAPFFVDGAWRFVSCRKPPFPNIAYGLPDPIAEELSAEDAALDAARMPASQWSSILRNALAHGGVAYLNRQGRSSFEEPVKMYAFVSGKYDQESEEKPKPLTAVNFLRISETDYRDFLRRWVCWLRDTGIAAASEAA